MTGDEDCSSTPSSTQQRCSTADVDDSAALPPTCDASAGAAAASDDAQLPRITRALTVRQPWAWAIASGVKDVENRGWSTTHRGWLAVHAAATPADAREGARCVQLLAAAGVAAPAEAQLARSAVVAVVYVHDVLPPQQAVASAWAQPRCFHWLLRDARALKTPVPCSGQIQLWELSSEVSAAIDAQL